MRDANNVIGYLNIIDQSEIKETPKALDIIKWPGLLFH